MWCHAMVVGGGRPWQAHRAGGQGCCTVPGAAVEGGGVGEEGGDVVVKGVGGGDGERRRMNFLQCFGNNWCTSVPSDLDY